MSRLVTWCLLLLLSTGASLLLAADKEAKVDQNGDLPPENALTRLGKVRVPRRDHLGAVNQVQFMRDDQTVVWIQDAELNIFWLRVSRITDFTHVVIWPRGSGKESHGMALPKGSQECFLCADGSTLAVMTKDGVLLFLDIPSGKERIRCPMARDTRLLHISADNHRALVWLGKEKVGEVWDLATKKPINRFEPGYPFGFSPDGRMVLLETKTGAKVLEVDTKREISSWDVPLHALRGVVFSPDERMVVVYCADFSIRLWEVATGKQRLLLSEYMKYINACVFSPDGKILAIGGDDKSARFWDVRDGKEIHAFSGHSETINGLAFSQDGRRLVSGSDDTTALIWQIPAACRERKFPQVALGLREKEKLWDKLGIAQEAAEAYAAMQKLASSPDESVAICRAQLLSKPTQLEEIQRWIAQLDDEEFAIREQASRLLERSGIEAGRAVEKALKGDCSVEMRSRLESVQQVWEKTQPRIRTLRAVELLEQIDTAEAVDVLRQLEKKTGDAAVRDDVRRSLGRLAAKRKGER